WMWGCDQKRSRPGRTSGASVPSTCARKPLYPARRGPTRRCIERVSIGRRCPGLSRRSPRGQTRDLTDQECPRDKPEVFPLWPVFFTPALTRRTLVSGGRSSNRPGGDRDGKVTGARVNNASIGSSADPRPLLEYDDAFWDLTLAVNLTAPYLL